MHTKSLDIAKEKPKSPRTASGVRGKKVRLNRSSLQPRTAADLEHLRDLLLSGEEEERRETGEYLEKAIDEDRLSYYLTDKPVPPIMPPVSGNLPQ